MSGALAMSILATVLWQSPWLLPAAVATGAIVLAGVLLLYPPQVRGLPRSWRWMPPTLRAMAIATLVASMVQPAVLRPRTASQQGAVVLLIDRSRSMGVSDRGRTPAELVSLAAGLGSLPEGARKESAPGLRGELEAIRARLEQVERNRGEAEYARLSGRGLPAAQARLEDAIVTLRQRVAALPAPVGAKGSDLPQRIADLKQLPPTLDEAATRLIRTRLDAAVRALAADQARADDKLFDDDPAVRTACVRTGRLTRAALVEQGLLRERTGLLANLPAGAPVIAYAFSDEAQVLPQFASSAARHDFDLQPDGMSSDVTGSLRAVTRWLAGRDIQAVVLLSDGRQVGGENPPNPDLSALHTPVFAVCAAQPGQRQDVSIARLDLPSSLRAGQTATLRADLRATTQPGTPIDLQLDAGERGQVQRVAASDDWTASAEFDLTFTRPGEISVTVTALPLAGEISDQNNRAQRWVKVGADPLRVTVISGADAGRQFASLHEALSRAPWVTLREVEEADTWRLSADTIVRQDVVILCDLPAEALWPQQWEALDDMVRRRGGSVILCAGAHLPAGYAASASAAGWLPYDLADKPSWQSWPGGEANFRLIPNRVAGARLPPSWQQLAPLARIFPLKRLRSGVMPLLIERATGAAVVTDAPRGRGRVIFIGTDESWRWRAEPGDGEKQQFWPQILNLIAPEPYAVNAGGVWLDASDIAPEPQRPITLRARVFNPDGSPSDESSQQVEVLLDDEEIRAATLSAIGGGRFEGMLDGLDPGEYILRLDAPDDESLEIPPEPALLPIHVADNAETEIADLSADAPLLRRMAESSGGRYLTLDQLNTLPRLLAENREKQNQLVEYTLWDSPYLFGFVLACLSTEWALRKKFGLA